MSPASRLPLYPFLADIGPEPQDGTQSIMFEKVVVIDSRGHLLGRLASIVAKELLCGQKVVCVRTEETNISGSREFGLPWEARPLRALRPVCQRPRLLAPGGPDSPRQLARLARQLEAEDTRRGFLCHGAGVAGLGIARRFESSRFLSWSAYPHPRPRSPIPPSSRSVPQPHQVR